MTDARAEFLAGDRPDDVVLYLSDRTLDDPGPLLEYGESVEGGVLLVMDGETGRSVFQSATEMEAMAFAGKAMRTEGEIDRDLTGGRCPKAGETGDAAGEERQGDAADADAADAGAGAADAGTAGADAASDEPVDHDARFVFAFAEEENPEVGGQYAEGDVIHAYAHCACGATYSQNWTVGEREE